MTDCPGRPNLPQSDILAGFAQSPSRQSGHCYQPAYHHGRTRQGLTLASCDWRFLGPEQGRRRSTPKQAHSANLSRSTSHSVAHCTLFLVVSPPSVVVLGLPAPCRLLDGSLLEVQTPKANMDCLSSLPLPRIHLGCMCAVRILLWVRYMRVDRDRSLRGGLCSPLFCPPQPFPLVVVCLGLFRSSSPRAPAARRVLGRRKLSLEFFSYSAMPTAYLGILDETVVTRQSPMSIRTDSQSRSI